MKWREDLKWDALRPVKTNVLSVPCETNPDHRQPWVELTAPFCLSLSFWHHSGLQHPQDIICVTDAIRHRQKLKSMLCVHEHLLASVISETMKNELYPLIYSETYHPDSPHLILFYYTGCLCLCLHWLQIIVMHRVWVVVWNVKCNSISAQWFCVVEGSVVFWCGVRGMREERSAASLKQFLIHIILTLKQDYFITTVVNEQQQKLH